MKLYGALDLAFAALYAWFGFVLTPGRSTAFNVALALVCALLAAGGVGLARRRALGPHARRSLACVALLVFAAVVVILLVASSAYLRGVYGPLGQGMSVMTLLVAALVRRSLRAVAAVPAALPPRAARA